MDIRTRKLMAVLSLFTSTALITGNLMAAQAAAPAATTTPAASTTTTTGPGGEKVEKLEKFVVTGSYIPTNETAFTAGVSPVVRIDQKVIDESGLTTTSELLQKITVSNGGSIPISNNATGFTPAGTA